MSRIKTAFGLSLLLVLPVLLLAGGAMAAGLESASSRGNSTIDQQASKTGINMTQTQLAASQAGKPPLDAVAPAKIATATFALG